MHSVTDHTVSFPISPQNLEGAIPTESQLVVKCNHLVKKYQVRISNQKRHTWVYWFLQPAGLQAVTCMHPASAQTLNTKAGFPGTHFLLALRGMCLEASPSQLETQFANLSQSHEDSIFGLLWWQFNSALNCFQNVSADLSDKWVPCHIISCLLLYTSRWFSWPTHQILQSNSVSTPQSNGSPETVLPPSPSGAGTPHCLSWQGSGKLGWVSPGTGRAVCVDNQLLTDKTPVKCSHSMSRWNYSLALLGAEPPHAMVDLSLLKTASPGSLWGSSPTESCHLPGAAPHIPEKSPCGHRLGAHWPCPKAARIP